MPRSVPRAGPRHFNTVGPCDSAEHHTGYLARISVGRGWLARFDHRAKAAPPPERMTRERLVTPRARVVEHARL